MKTLISAVAATLFLGVVTSPAIAQQQHPEAANAPKFGIAVVDVSYIFKEHKQFIATMEGMKDEMKNIDSQFKGKRDALMKLEEERNRLNVGTPEYSAKDDQFATKKAQLGLEVERVRKQFMTRESKVYFETYQDLSYKIAEYAKQRNIGLVLRFNGARPNGSDRGDILKDINKPVVFENNIDITRDIVAIVNADSRTASRPNRAPQ